MDDYSNISALQSTPYVNSSVAAYDAGNNQNYIESAVDWVKEDVGNINYHAAQSMAAATAIQVALCPNQLSQAINQPIKEGISHIFGGGKAHFVGSILKIASGVAVSSYVVNHIMNSYVDEVIAPVVNADMSDRHDMSLIVGTAISGAVSFMVGQGISCASKMIERYNNRS
ncbi:hypothetical protein GUI12_01570 [Anaplasmataceae bacterium AB001_6]|nr:hypothetical protein GUI12_01570 [Anaplasmataceae bacterium AB001_6]